MEYAAKFGKQILIQNCCDDGVKRDFQNYCVAQAYFQFCKKMVT